MVVGGVNGGLVAVWMGVLWGVVRTVLMYIDICVCLYTAVCVLFGESGHVCGVFWYLATPQAQAEGGSACPDAPLRIGKVIRAGTCEDATSRIIEMRQCRCFASRNLHVRRVGEMTLVIFVREPCFSAIRCD
jgi:hypothetical protein